MAEYSIPAYNERTFTGLVRHVYVRTNRAGRSLCCLLVNGRGVPGRSSWCAPCAGPSPTWPESCWG